ncbi:cholesterol 7-desaturase nvd 1-like [Ixodes scapularis]|uniref:cholesterol 7-desaturase nvd 1-like n=1 Tax=Ixodes scapularis TaxID=6945 RepID=UPI001C390212|nr:cholesterol 7-desaturase nvd 1-like [Ixodes scapularis]
MNDALLKSQFFIYGCLVATFVWILWTYSKRDSSKTQKKNRPVLQRYIRDETQPVFPNGWIPLLLSSELIINKVKSLNVLGEELVAFRTQDGVAHVMDAYCPHLGANLGVMGRVVGDCIECPFHGWRFRGEDGVCTHVPYASKRTNFIPFAGPDVDLYVIYICDLIYVLNVCVTPSCELYGGRDIVKTPRYLLIFCQILDFPTDPEFVKAKTWISKEAYGLLLAWYHADGKEPTWDVTEHQEITSGQWRRTGLWEKQIFGYMQDITENGADIHHFRQIHKASPFVGPQEYERVAGNSWACRVMTFDYDITWSEHGVKVCVNTDLRVKLFGWNVVTYHVVVWQLGPALNVAQASSPFGNLFYVFSFTPHGPRDIRGIIQTYADRSLLWPIRRFMESGTFSMVGRDVIIWDHKTFLKNPALVKEDATIKSFRKWYSQFYSSKSPTWRDVREKTVDW